MFPVHQLIQYFVVVVHLMEHDDPCKKEIKNFNKNKIKIFLQKKHNPEV